ncbi:MAG: AAA family ATPase [Oscillospiraceae bacterium]|jgi:CO dehydrogenase maturation factor|nr:AAA family ATPase [Oscillospiraceae bacterium]
MAEKKPIVIAVAGKGGTGKTTVCGMLIRGLTRRGAKILAVDADPNSNLNEVLGVDIQTTLGDIRETMVGRELNGEPVPAGMTKQEYAEFMMGDALTEEDSYDLLVMGRTQGAGCYCYVNGVLKTQVDRYSGAYDYIVVDNEAGLEHISRGTLPHIDVLLLISDASRRGIQAVGRIAQMVVDLKLRPGTSGLIVNRAPDGVLPDGVLEEIAAQRLSLLGVLPQDETVYRYDSDGKPSADVPEDAPIKTALRAITDKLGL